MPMTPHHTLDIDIASYADDIPPYISVRNINELIYCLEKATDTIFKWFSDNVMKSNADKCHMPVCTNNTVDIKMGAVDITKEVLYLRWNERHLKVSFETLKTLLQT